METFPEADGSWNRTRDLPLEIASTWLFTCSREAQTTLTTRPPRQSISTFLNSVLLDEGTQHRFTSSDNFKLLLGARFDCDGETTSNLPTN